MTQQIQQPSGQMGQAGQAGQQMGQQMGLRLQDVETPQERTALTNIAHSIEVCEWCADQCIQLADPNMIECIRLCRDVSDLGQTALALYSRDSVHAQTVLQAFQQAAQACGQECGRHQHGHCQECAQVLSQAANSIQQLFR